MSSMAAGAKSERTNRWLLIGAAALAVLAGVFIFVALSNASDSGSSKPKASAGNALVLVAKDTIGANTKITAGMFGQQSFSQSALVVNPAADESAVIGKVTRTEILKGQQLSFDALGISLGKQENQIAFSITPGQRGFAVPVSAAQLVAGLVVPDDRVDVILTYTENRGGPTGGQDNSVTRVETVLQNIRVLAVAQTTVENQPTLNAQGTPVANPTSTLGMRPDDVKPNPGAGTATLELTPDQVEQLTAAMSKGSLSLALRGVGDDKPTDTKPFFQDQFGPIPRPQAPPAP